MLHTFDINSGQGQLYATLGDEALFSRNFSMVVAKARENFVGARLGCVKAVKILCSRLDLGESDSEYLSHNLEKNIFSLVEQTRPRNDTVIKTANTEPGKTI